MPARSFDNINKGKNYNKVLPMVQVGFLSYDLFPEHPEFCANYKVANVSLKNNSYIFNDKLRICVVNLSRIELATEQDKASGIELWARVFTATTWEEVSILANQDPIFAEASKTIYRVTEDEHVRYHCDAIERGERTHRTLVNQLNEQEQQLADIEQQLADKDKQLQKIHQERQNKI